MIKKINVPIHDLGFFLFLFMSILLVIPSLLFFFKIEINSIYFFLALIIASITIFCSKKDTISTFQIILIGTIIIGILLLLSSQIFDTSADGNGYRKLMTGLLKDGWNPIYQTAESFNQSTRGGVLPNNIGDFSGISQWFWIEVYPKGPSIFGACLYAVTNNLESGKMYTMLTMVILFCFFYDYLQKRWLNKLQSMIIALVVALNPVSMSQCRSFYTDAALGNITMLLILSIIMYLDDKYEVKKKRLFVMIAFCILWSFHIKFNGILYAGLFCFTFFILFAFKIKRKTSIQKLFISLGTVTISSFLLGFSPYITNPLRMNELFPGITGNSPGATGNFTASTQGFNTVQIFLANIFSRMGDYWNEPKLPLKIPFTIAENEMDWYYYVPPHFGTFGMLFSGIFIIILILLIFLLKSYQAQLKQNYIYKTSLILLFISTIQCAVTPIAIGGLRYVGHFYLLIPYVLTLFFYFYNTMQYSTKKTAITIFTTLLISLILCNIAPYLKVYSNTLKEGRKTRQILTEMSKKYSGKTATVAFSVEEQENATAKGYLYNLKDYGIIHPNVLSPEELGDKIVFTCSYQIRFLVEEE